MINDTAKTTTCQEKWRPDPAKLWAICLLFGVNQVNHSILSSPKRQLGLRTTSIQSSFHEVTSPLTVKPSVGQAGARNELSLSFHYEIWNSQSLFYYQTSPSVSHSFEIQPSLVSSWEWSHKICQDACLLDLLTMWSDGVPMDLMFYFPRDNFDSSMTICGGFLKRWYSKSSKIRSI